MDKRIPFIPTEEEINALIASCGKKISAFLQLLKETGLRLGEADSLRWIDIDMERRVIILNDPEKSSEPRIFKVSQKLIDMLNALPRNTERVFVTSSRSAKKKVFYLQRKRAADKLRILGYLKSPSIHSVIGKQPRSTIRQRASYTFKDFLTTRKSRIRCSTFRSPKFYSKKRPTSSR